MKHVPKVFDITGMIVSKVWRGAGTAIFLELGELQGKKQQGEATISIEWSWRVDDGRKVLIGSFNEDDEIELVIALLHGLKIDGVELYSTLPEISVHFADGKSLCSFSTVDGDPQWAIRVANDYLYAENGLMVVGR